MFIQKRNSLLLLFSLLLATTAQLPILATANFIADLVQTTTVASPNTIGLSISFPQLMPHLSNSALKKCIKASALFNQASNVFHQTLHMPKGYKYSCTSTLYTTTITCTLDISKNLTLLQEIGNYTAALSGGSSAMEIGWDMEGSNFSNPLYSANYASFSTFLSNRSARSELLDQGDKFGIQTSRVYNVTTYLSDLSSIRNSVGSASLVGPGLTEDAQPAWYSQALNISINFSTTFTLRGVIFKDLTEASIENLMNDSYSRGYLLKRLTDGNENLLNLSSVKVGLSQIKMTTGDGIFGVTNSFAAALWALDTAVEFSGLGGNYINFFNTFNPSNQSILGPAPLFEPTPLYYGLLFGILALESTPTFEFSRIQAGSSSEIKVFGFRKTFSYRVLIINKSLNKNLNGTVNIKIGDLSGLNCIYLQAADLSSTENVTIGSVQWSSNTSQFVGTYTSYTYFVNQTTGFYNINISYAQAAICNTISKKVYRRFKKGSSSHLSDIFITFPLSILILYFFS